jgi:UDP-N-acetylglucosamine--N-acetylmuramyl-(pentapeptide) pyrophosphoryl-undecaprenol N-acetylglucosamine transferase
MKTILLVGGGTLGSVNPLLATAAELKKASSDIQCAFWGEQNKRDQSVVEEAGIPFSTIPAGKFRRYLSLRNIIDVPVIAWSTIVACRKLRKLKPAMVVTAGSYVAVPVVWAARRLHIPVLLYQQDVTLGLANKLIAKHAKFRCAVADLPARLLPQPVDVVGYALRVDLRTGNASKAATKYKLDEKKSTILVIGGSSGALELNRRFVAALPFLQPDIQVIHITGEGKEIPIARPGYVPVSFTNRELPDLYALATFVVSRAGSNVLAELIALGKPALIVPLPNTHQVQNAAALEERGALVRAEQDLTPQAFAELLNSIVKNPERLAVLKSAMAQIWDTDGAKKLAALILKNL